MKLLTASTSALLAFAMLGQPSFGETVDIVAGKDNTLYQSAGGGISNGAGDHFFAGFTGDFSQRHGMIWFDLSSIPQGSTINSASVQLHMSKTIVGPFPHDLRAALKDWGEAGSNAPGEEGGGTTAQPGDATWMHTFSADQFWDAPGGDYAAAASATTTVGDIGDYEWSGPELTADVQAWVDGTSANFGWFVVNTGNGNTAKRFDTRENPIAGNRPTLTIDFTPAAPDCPSDLDDSGGIDSGDLNIVLGGFGCTGDDCPGDIDASGATDSTDLNLILAAFGDECP